MTVVVAELLKELRLKKTQALNRDAIENIAFDDTIDFQSRVDQLQFLAKSLYDDESQDYAAALIPALRAIALQKGIHTATENSPLTAVEAEALTIHDRHTPGLVKSLGINWTPTYDATVTLTKSFEDGRQAYHLSGYASDDQIDRDGDRMSARALKTMADIINAGGINLFTDHNHGVFDSLGVFTKAEVQDGKLWVQARLEDPDINPKVAQLLHKMESGVRVGLSIGGDMDGSHRVSEGTKSVRIIDGVKLFEISAVGLPSNAGAVLTASERF